MQRYKVTLAYDGSDYVGFQIQENGLSVQEVFERALYKMSKGQVIKVVASGRTDSGVHARGQVLHFDYPSAIAKESLLRALNSILPLDIRVLMVEKVSQAFHARYHTSGKRYVYRVDVGDICDPFKQRYTLYHPYRLDLERMQTALNDLLGTHDFTSFCSTKTDKENRVRTIRQAQVHYEAATNEVVFTLEGDGFLYNMVRIIVGTALHIGDGLKDVSEMRRLLAVKDRREAGPTAPAKGLYLDRVTYKPEDQWFQTYEENKGLI